MYNIYCASIILRSYLQIPKSEEEWQAVAKDFMEKCQFPHCLGALDGKHIYCIFSLQAHSGSMRHNCKSRFSDLMMAAVDATCKFIYCTLVLVLRAGSKMLVSLPILL